MDSKLIIRLPPDLVSRCWRYGEQIVSDYASGWNANSRAVSCFDAEQNTELQALARMAECALCLWARQPIEKLDWGRHCDAGFDLAVGDFRIDVKHTKNGRYLIWPIAKNSIFESKKFDALVLVIGTPERGFELAGWMSKPGFRRNRKTAQEGGKLFPGTWFVDRDDLAPMSCLLPHYDAQADFAGSINDGFAAIRARIAAGGPSWTPK